jgi:hypothetical protein
MRFGFQEPYSYFIAKLEKIHDFRDVSDNEAIIDFLHTQRSESVDYCDIHSHLAAAERIIIIIVADINAFLCLYGRLLQS